MTRKAKKPKGLSQKQIDIFLKGKKTRIALLTKAVEVQTYWKSIAPVFDPDDPKEKRKWPAHGKPGDYRDGIKIGDVTEDADGLSVRVSATDFKSRWIEYGTEHMPKQAPLAKVKSKFQGRG